MRAVQHIHNQSWLPEHFQVPAQTRTRPHGRSTAAQTTGLGSITALNAEMLQPSSKFVLAVAVY